jgi:hypothetical protein
MTRFVLTAFAVLGALATAAACGSKQKKPATTAENHHDDDDASADDAGAAAAGDGAPKASPCTGFEMDLMDALGQSACEVPNPKPDDKPIDVKGKLEVTALSTANKVVPGGHDDIIVTFTNKSAAPLPLLFLIDPLPRFQVEAYRVKGAVRVDLPPGNQPSVPDNLHREPSQPGTARITLAPNGKATVKVGWDATKMRWAPEKLRGTPPEQGYPRAAAGPLPKGKYVLRVVTPLIGVFEGIDHEVSAPRTPIEVGN